MDLRQRVVEAATKSFSTFGYKGTTMDQVARIADVGKGTIYTFFASKEELFTAILASLIAEMKAVAEAEISPEGPFSVNLERALRGILTFRSRHMLLVKLSQEVRDQGTARAKEGLLRVEDAIVQFIARHLRTGVERGELDTRGTAPEVISFVMLRAYTSLVRDFSEQYYSLSDEQIANVIRLIFTDGIGRN